LGSGAHMAWSDTNKCNEVSNGGTYTLCYVHVLTGLVEVDLTETETYYHTIEPGQQTLYNMTISNPTPGPAELVSDTFSVSLEGVPNNWTATLYFTTNNTPIFDSTPVFLRGGEVAPLYMRVRAPSIYQAHADEIATITVTAVSYKDPAIRDERFTVTLMDVVHGIDLDTSHYQVDVEQGESAYFSITVTNTGNVYDTFAFYDPSTLEGQVEWALPFGWGLDFLHSISLDPGQSVTRNLQVSVPSSQEPGTSVIYLKGWSTGEPVLSIEQGTFDVLELWINVSIKSTGNIVFKTHERTLEVLPGECAEFEIAVSKNFTPGYLIFTTSGGPEEQPSEVSDETWSFDHWTVDLDFEGAPGGNAIPDDAPRYWPVTPPDQAINITVEMCAPHNATAGLGESVMVRAHLEGAVRVRDSVVLLTNVIQKYDLEASVPETILSLYPGQTYQLNTTIDNLGNGADRYDISINSITNSSGYSQVWDLDIPRVLFEELDRDEFQTIPILITVPEMTHAGQYTIIFDVLSEESYEGTKIRDNIVLQVEIIEFHDMRIELDPLVESKIKTTAPGRTVRFIMNITNFGNVPDQPSLHNYTQQTGASNTMVWNTAPSMSPLLTNWIVTYALLKDFDTEYPIEAPCIGQTGADALTLGEPEPTEDCFKSASTNAITLPVMDPYTTLQVVVIIEIDPGAQLANREIGIKVMSEHGSSEAGGDHDETEVWDDSCTLDDNKDGIPDNYRPNCDTNEQVIELRLRAPDLRIKEVTVGTYRGDVGEMLSVNVEVVNDGNAHATDVNIILCAGQSESDIEKNGCDEENIVYRQIVQAIMPTPSDEETTPQIALLYMVEAGSHDVVVVVDPDNVIVETNEDNNVRQVPEKMGSTLGVLDVGIEIVAQFTVPTLIVGATLALLGVVTVVMRGRREEAKMRFAEKTSIISNLDDEEDMIF